MVELNLDLIEDRPTEKPKAIAIYSKDDIRALAHALAERYPKAPNNRWAEESTLNAEWEMFKSDSSVQRCGLAVDLGLHNGTMHQYWCHKTWYIDNGYTIIEFADLIAQDISFDAPPIESLFGGV